MSLLVLVAALVLFVSGPMPAHAERANLAIGITQFPSTLHPGIESMMAKTYVLGMTRRPITAYDADWELVCLLCTELPTLENGGARLEKTPDGADGIAVTYTLKPGLTWGDGTPVTTEDVVFGWQVGRHPLSGVLPKEFFRRLYKIDVKDDRTFTLHYDKVFFEYNAAAALGILPAHLERAPFADPENYRDRTLYAIEPTMPGLYFGPYVISDVVAGSHVVLARNPHWAGEKPAFDRIVVRAIENTAALEANILSGEIDMIAGELGLNINQAIDFERRHADRFQILFQPGLFYEHIDLMLANPILADRRVRRALLLALDRELIGEQLFAGRQPTAHGSVSPLDPMFAEDVPRHAHDPAQAATLLDAAGWRLGDDGVRRDAGGNPLSLSLMTTAGDRTRELVQQVLQQQWKAIGVEVRLRNEPARVFFGQTVSRRQFDAMAMFSWISAPESVPRTTLHSAHIPTADNGWSGQNYTGYSNPRMDQLIERIEVELDEDRRRALWRELQILYAEDLPALPLYFRAQSFILPPWLDGLTPTGHQYPSTLWIEDWRAR